MWLCPMYVYQRCFGVVYILRIRTVQELFEAKYSLGRVYQYNDNDFFISILISTKLLYSRNT